MTDYRLPEGMTAERLREMAKSFDFFAPGSIGSDLRAWADAIDPPKPFVVTDEMVEAALEAFHEVYDDASWPDGYTDSYVRNKRKSMRAAIEAVECGWTPPGGVDSGAGLHALLGKAETERNDLEHQLFEARRERSELASDLAKLSDRLAMAEGLLRRVTIEAMVWESTGGVPVNGGGWWVGSKDWPNESHKVNVTADEAEYLRSLDGEGDGDE